MLNKELWAKLNVEGNKFDDVIRLIEKAEAKKINVIEFKIDPLEGITGNKKLDSEIIGQLKELNIKVSYIEAAQKKPVAKIKCKHTAHKLYNKKLSHEDNIKNFLSQNIGIIKLDKEDKKSFAICPS